MSSFEIYNKSSVDMSEISSNSIDLIVGSPPYNIGTKYAENNDLMNFEEYKNMMDRVIKECHRILKKEGTCIIELADSVLSEGRYIQLAGLIQDLAINSGFYLESRHINFTMSENHIEKLEHDWNKDYTTVKNAHSNCHQILIFKKKQTKWKPGNIFYYNYEAAEGHPCPTPLPIYTFILENYYKNGDRVLDPFCGTARIGVQVVKRKGKFIGYEVSKTIAESSRKKLSKIA